MSHTDGFSAQREIGIVCMRFQKLQMRECMKVKNAFITKAVEDSADGDGVKNLKLQRVINGCVAYCVFSIIALVSFC